jgi:small subunit ribosomal protein S5
MADATNITAPAPAAAPAAPTEARPAEHRGGPGGGNRRGGPGGGGNNNRRGGPGGNRKRQDSQRNDRGESDLIEKVVHINRCAKVVKGGRRFSFSALIVVGDRKGRVGLGFGKANEVADAIRKATDGAKKNMETICLKGGTIPHEVLGIHGGSKVLLRPASEGTGLIAGPAVRAVTEAAGVKDLLTKSLGSSNPGNVVKATLEALRQLRPKEQIYKTRGKTIRTKSDVKVEAEVAVVA